MALTQFETGLTIGQGLGRLPLALEICQARQSECHALRLPITKNHDSRYDRLYAPHGGRLFGLPTEVGKDSVLWMRRNHHCPGPYTKKDTFSSATAHTPNHPLFPCLAYPQKPDIQPTIGGRMDGRNPCKASWAEGLPKGKQSVFIWVHPSKRPSFQRSL